MVTIASHQSASLLLVVFMYKRVELNFDVVYTRPSFEEVASMPKRTNIYLPEEQTRRLRKLAQKKDVSMSELVRRAIEEYLNKEEKR